MKKIISLILCSAIIFCLAACSEDKIAEPEVSINDISLEYTDSDIIPEAPSNEYNDIFELIDCSAIDFSQATEPCTYRNFEDYADQISRANFQGVPVIVDQIRSTEELTADDDIKQREFYISILFAIWRISEEDSYEICGYSEKLNASEEPIRGMDNTEYIKAAYLYTKENAPKIIASDADTETKLKQLRMCGVLALPYVLEELKKGNSEYEAYFTELGLHLTAAQYMEYVLHSEDPDTDIKTDSKISGFNHIKWLNEKAPYLRVMFKYLDRLCAEPTAE